MVDRTAKWGILSTAHINRRLIPEIQASDRSHLLAVASRSEERAREYASHWNIDRWYEGYEALLEDPEIDVVYNPLPNHLHAEWTIKALEAGKHVLCEKPMCITMEELEAVRKAAINTGKHVAEAFMYLHHPQTALFKAIVDEGRIGELRTMHSTFCFTFTRDENYRVHESRGGGALWDVGVYPVSFFQHLVGSEPVDVAGQAYPEGIDLRFTASMKYAPGITGQFFVGFDSAFSTFTRIIGSKAILEITRPFNYTDECRAVIRQDGEVESLELPRASLYRGEIEDMNDVVLQGTSPKISLEQTFGHIRTIIRLRESAGQS